MPEFFWAIVVIVIFAAWLGWLPASGYEPLSAGFWIWAKHLIAPTITLVFGHLAHVSRLTRSSRSNSASGDSGSVPDLTVP